MSEWFPASELAKLDSMPDTVQGVLLRAKKEGWTSRPRKGRGGGKEFHISSLPPETQRALRQKSPVKELQVVDNAGKTPPKAPERNDQGLTPDELALIHKYRAMTPQQKVQAQTIIDVIAQPKVDDGTNP